MTRQNELHRAKIKNRWRKILFAMIFYSSRFFYSSGNGRTIVDRDVKFFDMLRIKISKLYVNPAQRKFRFNQIKSLS